MKKILNSGIGRLIIVILLVLVQVSFFLFEIVEFSKYYIYITIILNVLSLFAVIVLVNKQINPTIKIVWIIAIMAFPLLGGLLYLCFGHTHIPEKLKHNIDEIHEITIKLSEQKKDVLEQLQKEDKSIANLSQYIVQYAGYPIYKNSAATYYKIGEEYFAALKEELEQAKEFIFMEYFIVASGTFWNEILEILERKVKQGVEVRFMYDDMGCVALLPYQYYNQLIAKGIKCIAFNPIVPVFALIMNNRDHRKITVIDGKVGFTGGINLSDEYINIESRFGHWKDTGIKVEGEAVWNFTQMFLEMWNTEQLTDREFSQYHRTFPVHTYEDGYIQPYGDTPLDNETLGENIYMNIINNAKEYVYIYTPYLIVDNEVITSLCLAAKRGVDVRIVTPGIPDKKLIYYLTQSYYEPLLAAGVKIFQYTPGFIHAKCFLSDDHIATVGTINLDYRSLYHHYECGVLVYQSRLIPVLKKDMMHTFEVSEEVTKQWYAQRGGAIRLRSCLIRLFAPLL